MFFSTNEATPTDSIHQRNESRKKKQFAAFLSSADETSEQASPLIATQPTHAQPLIDPLKLYEMKKVTCVAYSRKSIQLLSFYIQKLQNHYVDIISASSREVDNKVSLKEKVAIKSLVVKVAREFKLLSQSHQQLIERKEKIDSSELTILEDIVKLVAQLNTEFTEARYSTAKEGGTSEEPKLKTLEEALPSVSGKLNLDLGVKYVIQEWMDLSVHIPTTSSTTTTKATIGEKAKKEYLLDLGLLESEYTLEQ